MKNEKYKYGYYLKNVTCIFHFSLFIFHLLLIKTLRRKDAKFSYPLCLCVFAF